MRVVSGALLAVMSCASWAQPISSDEFADFSAKFAAVTSITYDLGARCKSAIRDDLNHSVCKQFQRSFDRMRDVLRANQKYWPDKELFAREGMESVTGREIREYSLSLELMIESIKAMDYVEEYRAMLQ